MAIYNNRICRDCGKKFSGGPRAWYCPGCRDIRKREREAYHKRKGPERHIGDTDICEKCGEPYVINSGLQRFCCSCSKINNKEVDRKQGLNYYYQNKNDINQKRNQTRREKRVIKNMKYEQRNYALIESKNYDELDGFLTDMVNSSIFESDWISDTEFNPDTFNQLKELFWFSKASIYDIRRKYRLGRAEFCRMFFIPCRTVENWETDKKDHHEIPIYLKLAIYQILSGKDFC